MSKKISGIDIFRIAAAVMVIAIHTYPFADISETAEFVVTRVICRVAVPFFFTASGAFFISPYAQNCAKLKEFVKKTVLIYAFSIVLYIPVNIYNGYFDTENLLIEIIRDIFFDGTIYHLWYLPAAVIGACIAWLLVRKLGFVKALVCSGALYLIGLLGDSYYGIIKSISGINAIYEAMFQLFDYTRNGIFFAPLFFVMGGYAAEREGGRGKDKMLLVLFADLMLVEGLLLKIFEFQRHDSMYVFLVPTVFFLFCVLCGMKGERKKEYSRISLYMYIVHPMIIVVIRFASKLLKLENLFVENNLVHFLAVTVCSAVFAMLLAKLIPLKHRDKKLRAWREIDLDALRNNANELKSVCPQGCELMAVVKADAYGHGAFPVSVCLEKMGIKAFAVATVDEAVELRKFGIRGDILVLGYTAPERAHELKKYRITQTVVSPEHAKALNSRNVKINVHLKIDTGMHRLGIEADRIEDIISCFKLENLNVTGVFSHLCAADDLAENSVLFTKCQINAFKRVLTEVRENCSKTVKAHLQSSYGLLNHTVDECDYVRAGIALYGAYSSIGDEVLHKLNLAPVMKLKACVTQIKTVGEGETVGYGRKFKAEHETVIATVSIGYADGLPRNYTGNVVIKGRKAPIIGRICMDQMSVDVSDIPNAAVGDTVTVIGDGVTAEMIAHNTGTITNEILSGIGKRTDTVTMHA